MGNGDYRHPTTNVVLGNLYDYVPWGRILKMTYPDGEQVRYFHSYGGDLFRINGYDLGNSSSQVFTGVWHSWYEATERTWNTETAQKPRLPTMRIHYDFIRSYLDQQSMGAAQR